VRAFFSKFDLEATEAETAKMAKEMKDSAGIEDN